jgi:hypothetical protein
MTTAGRIPNLALLALASALAVAPAPARGQSTATARSEKPRAAAKPEKAVVPFELLASNHMVVRARVNGQGPYWLVFDLGAPITLVSPRAAEAAGLIKKGSARPLLFGTRGEEKLKALKVGGLDVKDLSVVVMDHPTLRLLGGMLGRRLDGIIGFTFFARYKTTIDYAAREMTFEPVDYTLPDLLKELPARLTGPKTVKRVVVSPGALFGLTVAPATGAAAGSGVTISAVTPGSPSEIAGLKAGDLLTALDGRWTTSVLDAYSAASSVRPGRRVDAAIVRDGHELTLPIVPAEGF